MLPTLLLLIDKPLMMVSGKLFEQELLMGASKTLLHGWAHIFERERNPPRGFLPVKKGCGCRLV